MSSRTPSVKNVFEFYVKHEDVCVKDFTRLFGQKFRSYRKFDTPEFYLALYRGVRSVVKRVRSLTKKKALDAKSSFLAQPFSVPSLKFESEQDEQLAIDLSTERERNVSLKRKLSDLTENNDKKSAEIQTLEECFEDAIADIDRKRLELKTTVTEKDGIGTALEMALTEKDSIGTALDQFRANYLSAATKVDKLETKLKESRVNSRGITKRMSKKIKRRETQLNKLASQSSEVQQAVQKTNLELDRNEDKLAHKDKMLEQAELEIKALKSERIDFQKKISYLKIRLQDSNHTVTSDSLQEEVDKLRNENKQLNHSVSTMEDDKIETFVDGKYTDEVRQVVMELVSSCNVSMKKVDEIIRVVLKGLANKDVSRLPSLACRSTILKEARYLAKKQVAEAMLVNTTPTENEGNCLHFDGTSKFHKHYQNWQVTLLDGKTLSAGLHEMSGGDTKSTLESFNEIVDELAGTITQNDKDNSVASLVASIKNTISDQGAVNPCFNRELQALREKVLPLAIENWDSLPETERDKLADMGNFFCKLHLLVNFATECDKTLASFETIALEKNTGQFFSTTESGPGRLVRTAVKAFHSRGSEEAGVASHFKAFLDGQNEKLCLVPYIGNRFNVLFYDAAAVYYHRNHIQHFLDNWPAQNRLLAAVHEDICKKVNLAGIRALGIIDKIVTGPFWRMLQKHNSILETNAHLETMRQRFTEWCSDASPLLRGETMFDETDPDLAVHRDVLYTALFADTDDAELDMFTQQALELLMHSMLLLLERQAQDQLLDGKYAKPDDLLTKQAANVPATNAASERDFGILDMLVRMKPSGSVLLYESLTMWMNNKTSKWLNSKSGTERETLMKEARENVPLAQKRYRERTDKIHQQRAEALQAKQQAKEDSEQKQTQKKILATNNIVPLGGVWSSAAEVDQQLENFSAEEGRAAIIAQLNFHKQVLKSKGEKELFYQSRTVQGRRTIYTLDTLAQNLKTVLELNPSDTTNNETPNTIFRPPGQEEMLFKAEKAKLASRLKEARIKRAINCQKQQLPRFECDPKLLVGCRVKHKCIEEDADAEAWFSGIVLKLVKIEKNAPLKSVFKIQYDVDNSNWNFPLLMDMKKGDLIVETGVP